MRKLYLVLSGLVLLAVLAQFYFAAYGAFSIPREHADFSMHSVNGIMVIPLLSLLTTLAARLARAPGRLIGLAAAPFGLVLVQILLFVLTHMVTAFEYDRSSPGGQVILGFHAINALGILTVAALGFHRASRLVLARPAAERVA